MVGIRLIMLKSSPDSLSSSGGKLGCLLWSGLVCLHFEKEWLFLLLLNTYIDVVTLLNRRKYV